MTVLIILFGVLTLLAGIIIVVDPNIIFGFLQNNLEKLMLHILAVVVRLIIGALLIVQSDLSKFPTVIEVIGWISIVAAIVLASIGRRNFTRLMSWALSFSKPFGRVGGIFAVAFGACLVYAFI